MNNELSHIEQLLRNCQCQEALQAIEEYLSRGDVPNAAEAYYLRGNAYRQLSDWRLALNSYNRAIELDAQSPAVTARQSLIEILDFFNHDLYNP
ncbi:MAG: tetratricopeptide repeat protein [Muribaculaceae bacterium]